MHWRRGDGMLSFAQNFEDVMLERLFFGRTDGFYVDVGASHPIDLSVTKHFYDKGWSGINIEPLQAKYRLLAEHRPRDTNLNVAIGNSTGPLSFAEVILNDALSTFDAARAAALEAGGFEVRRYDIEVIGLNSILDRYATGRNIDFLKIDVEGHEASVLASIDLSRWRPKVLLVEAVGPMDEFPGWDKFDPLQRANWRQWEEGVISNGYLAAHFDGLNRFYLREDFDYLVPRLAIPPGVFDHILRDIAVSAINQPKSEDLIQLLRQNRPILVEQSNPRQDPRARPLVIDALVKAVRSYRLALPLFGEIGGRAYRTLATQRFRCFSRLRLDNKQLRSLVRRLLVSIFTRMSKTPQKLPRRVADEATSVASTQVD